MMTLAQAQTATLEQLTDELAAAGWDSTQQTREEALAAVVNLLAECGDKDGLSQYRYEPGHLYELRGDAYVHCYACHPSLTMQQAIDAYEAG